MKECTIVAIGTIALCVSACGSSRQVAKTEAKDSVLVEQRDTLIEVTTITIDRNEAGDTLKTSVVTDRTRARDRDRIAKQETKTIIKTDTVYVAVRDSVYVETPDRVGGDGSVRPSAFVSALKWVFWIIVSLTVFIVVIKFLK